MSCHERPQSTRYGHLSAFRREIAALSAIDYFASAARPQVELALAEVETAANRRFSRDAAFAHGLDVTALHNHFFYDSPKVYFMHIGGEGEADVLAAGVKAVWDAIRAVRAERLQPASGFGGPAPVDGDIDADELAEIVGHPATTTDGVVKITIGRSGHMHGQTIGGSMGLTTWAAFSGSDALAAIDGDFIMSADEVQPVLRALRDAGLHVVALHNHMIGERPGFYFTHYWGKGPATELAGALRSALDAQATVGKAQAQHQEP